MTIWTSGMRLTPARLNDTGLTLKFKTADESVASSTTLQNDDALFFAGAANTDYAILAKLYVTSASTTPDFKFAFTVPSGATFNVYGTNAAFANSSEFNVSGTSAAFALGDTAGQSAIWIDGFVRFGSTAGNFQLQWAQNTSNGTAVIVKAGSWLRAIRNG